jgi:uncharacterized protein YbjT (DUF2867 family)
LNVIIFGATGMIGTGVLLECLADARVASVLAIGRTACGVRHPKLRELIRTDLFDYSDIADDLTGRDACFFCVGVSAVGMDEATYHRVTYELTVAAAAALAAVNPGMTFCYVSGAGTDTTERGRVMWARVKGKTENRLMQLPLDAFMFRPGYVQPLGGARSKTRLYRAVYTVFGPLYPLLRRVLPRQVTTTENVGRAMIEVAANGCAERILDTADINALAGTTRGVRLA